MQSQAMIELTVSRRTLVVAALLGATGSVLVTGPQAAAKATVDRSAPAADTKLTETPSIVEIWFTEPVTPERTWIVVIGPAGDRVDLGDSTIDQDGSPQSRVAVSLRAGLAAGDYVVHWNASSEAGDSDAFGDFAFSLAESAAICPGASSGASPVAGACPAPPLEGEVGMEITTGDLTITLAAGSTTAGPIDLVVTLTDSAGAPVTDAFVSVRARHLEMDHGEFPKMTTSDGSGTYSVEGVGMGMGGAWRVAVDVIRPGQDPVTTMFLIDLEGLS